MSSWWTAIHGHGHPALDAALKAQLGVMNHVMFGGLTHEPAARLAQLLVEITPAGLETVFFSDSGSVSVEVAVKMALQYWRSRGRPGKHRLMTWRGGYHGDTFTPMSICDPDGGMHSLWTDILARQVFAPQVPRDYDPAYSAAFEQQLARARRRTGGRRRRAGGAGGGRDAVPRPPLPARPARDLPTARRAADLRRDRHRLRPHRRAVRRRPRRGEPRHHVRRQGADRRISHPGRHAVHHRHRAHHQRRRGRRADARAHLHGQSAGLRGVGGQRRAAARPGLAGAGRRDSRRPGGRTRARPGAARRDRRPGVRRHRRHRMRPARSTWPSPPRRHWTAASGCARSATWSTRCRRYICSPGEIAQITSAMVEVARLTGSRRLVKGTDRDSPASGWGPRSAGIPRTAGLAGGGGEAAPRGRAASLVAAASRRRHRAGSGVQRLPRPVTASRRDRGRRCGAAHVGRRGHRFPPGHRRHRTAPAVRVRARRVRRRRPRGCCSPRDTRPTWARSSACPARVRCWCPTPIRTHPWWTPAGCRGPGWW